MITRRSKTAIFSRSEKKSENTHKLAQKDTEAIWVKKNSKVHYDYKDHVKCGADSKMITNYSITDAAVHNSNRCIELIDDKDNVTYAGSANSSKEIAENLPESCENQICEKGHQGHSLTDEHKENNCIKSKIRCRIEHIFSL